MLTKHQLDRLGWICDDEGFFIETVDLLDTFKQLSNTTKSVAADKKEIDRLRKAIGGLSVDTRMVIALSHTMYLKEQLGITVKESNAYGYGKVKNFVDPVNALIRTLNDLRFVDSITKRQAIGDYALALFKKYDIHAGTSETGAFTEYLSIVFEALGENYTPHNAARAALK